MKSKEFIKLFINKIVEDFPYLHCSYGFDSLDNSHTIEILPSSFLDINDDFEQIEDNFYDDFFKLYPNEIVYIITANSSFPVSNPIYTLAGVSYNSLIENDVTNVNNAIVLVFNSLNIHTRNNLSFNPIDVKHNTFGNNAVEQFLFPNELIITNIANAGEGNYALAA